MTKDSIIRFLVALGVDYSEIVDSGRKWINSPCVLAPWLHGGGADARPSFGVYVNDNGPSAYYCFGCTPEGRGLHWLIHNVFLGSGEYPKEAAIIYSREEIHSPDEEAFYVSIDPWAYNIEPETVVTTPLPGMVLRQYPLLQGATGREAQRCREWLEDERHIPAWIQNKARVRYDPNGQTVIFALTDVKGAVYVLRARSRLRKDIWTINPVRAGFPDLKFPKIKDVGVWFGMFLINWRKPVAVVEGELDMLRLMSLGFHNTIASATNMAAKSQLDALMANNLISGFDADKGGDHAHRRLTERVRGKATIWRANWALATKTDGKPCKDSGDLPGKDELRIVMDNLEDP